MKISCTTAELDHGMNVTAAKLELAEMKIGTVRTLWGIVVARHGKDAFEISTVTCKNVRSLNDTADSIAIVKAADRIVANTFNGFVHESAKLAKLHVKHNRIAQAKRNLRGALSGIEG